MEDNEGIYFDGSSSPAFKINETVLAQRQNIFCTAIVEAIDKKVGNDGFLQFFYYVHYPDEDRRLDQWLEEDRLRHTTIGPSKKTRGGKPSGLALSLSGGNVVGGTTTASGGRMLRSRSQLQNQNLATSTTTTTVDLVRGGSDSRGASTTAASGGGRSASSSLAPGTTSTSIVASNTSSNIAEIVANASSINQQQGGGISGTTTVSSSAGGGVGVVNNQFSAGKNAVQGAGTRRNGDSKFFDRPKNIAKFYIGEMEVDAWYYSPFLLAHPQVRSNLENRDNLWSSVPGSTSLSISDASASSSSGGGGVGSNNNSNMNADNFNNASNENNFKSCNNISGANVDATSKQDFALHVCEYCFETFLDHLSVLHHLTVCNLRPPGREVYRDTQQQLIVFECDGAMHPAFARNIALISKAFLEHKSLDNDMVPFVFYVLCLFNENGCRITGYFSREKKNPEGYNLSCILTLPQYQSKGFGRFMIDMSYEMSKRELRPGSPEKPLSDLGEKMYRSAWKDRVMDVMVANRCMEGHSITIDQVIRETGMINADVRTALRDLKLLDSKELKIVVQPDLVRDHLRNKIKRMRKHAAFEPLLFHWFPHWYNPHESMKSIKLIQDSKYSSSNKLQQQQQQNVVRVTTEPLFQVLQQQKNLIVSGGNSSSSSSSSAANQNLATKESGRRRGRN